MKKRILSLALTAVCAVSLAGCGSKDAAEATTTTAAAKDGETKVEAASGLAKEGVFVVGFDAEFPPYGYMADDGSYTGFDLELAEEVCKRNGWELDKKPINWDSKDMELESGLIDCIWNGFTMNGREDSYTFSEPYVDNSIVVVVSSSSDIKALTDLSGKFVTVQADSSGLAALEGEDATEENKQLAASFASLDQVADYNTAFMNLEAGSTDAVILDIGVAKYHINEKSDKFVMLDDDITSELYAVGFKKGNDVLCNKVQETLKAMQDDGTIAKIAEKYADYNLPEMLCEFK
ncbi:MAG: transporter substrate-binding domain-containing protein [Lachnospiraceae bacterium]|nr:transporter substrate-binding domain-containing protein [Lachnospiraceae bacterium]